MNVRRVLIALIALLLLPAAAAAKPRHVEVQLLGLNDFHGHLESTTPGTIASSPSEPRVPAGGAEYLATHIRNLEADERNSLVVSAGDLIGASPLLSALFHDEPTIEAMNRIGLDLNSVGNHEFDEGAAELRRMQRGGCHPTDGCQDGTGFSGATFDFLAANVVRERTGRTLFRPYAIRRFQGVKVGFIGMTLEGTPDIVSPSGVAGLDFLDEAETANRYARELRRRGVRAIVVLLHEGGVQSQPGGVNDCNGISGPIVDIVGRTTKAVDLFVTGHTHSAYNCVIDGRPVTSASSFGRLVTDIDLTLDRRSRDVVEVAANNMIVTQNVFKAGDITQLIERYDAIAAPLRDRVIGRISADITRTPDDSGENAAGNLIADAQLAATADPDTGGAVAAFMNPGGVRSDFTFAQGGSEGDGNVTYGESFTVQPFGNSLVTMTLTGAQLYETLKQQWCGQGFARVLLPSATVAYSYDQSAAAALVGQPCAGAANPASGLTIGGTPVDPAASYRITVNSFLADGGDLFSVLREGTDRLGGAVDTDALEAYLAPSLDGAPIAPPALDRIDVVP
ncbi:MAG TPA: bifunctional metallophosphatase/5'-nucleotidase [Thermoleophilaceae bacterium]|jgi:5'-nucleotidase|nr:bifunctional metallophosphatase/5'-nucleotidase [Thermoleophilaceae bacterium]